MTTPMFVPGRLRKTALIRRAPNAEERRTFKSTASTRAHRPSAARGWAALIGTRSERPMPRLSNRIRRAKDASRVRTGVFLPVQLDVREPAGRHTRSRGPFPTAWKRCAHRHFYIASLVNAPLPDDAAYIPRLTPCGGCEVISRATGRRKGPRDGRSAAESEEAAARSRLEAHRVMERFLDADGFAGAHKGHRDPCRDGLGALSPRTARDVSRA